MTRPDTAAIADAVEQQLETLRQIVPGGLLAPEDYEAAYIDVSAALGVPIDEVREASLERLTMVGSG